MTIAGRRTRRRATILRPNCFRAGNDSRANILSADAGHGRRQFDGDQPRLFVVPIDHACRRLGSADRSAETEFAAMTTNQRPAEKFQTQRRPNDTATARCARTFQCLERSDSEGEPDELAGAEAWTEGEMPEQNLEEGEVAYNYDEWDRELTDHRLGWCRVIEKKVKHGDREFVEQTRERHQGVISSIRHQFQLMKPEELPRVTNELDGEEYDLNAVIDLRHRSPCRWPAVGTDLHQTPAPASRCGGFVPAGSVVIDRAHHWPSSLQPYTHPGRRIIEIEKEGLVLMSEALEAVGDIYSINGFTSEGRRNVKFYVVKDFDEKYSDEVKQRIGGITYQNNTRLGRGDSSRDGKTGETGGAHAPADRAVRRAALRSRLRRCALRARGHARSFAPGQDSGHHALLHHDRSRIGSELRDLYGEIGYTIIDDVLTLPERCRGFIAG